MQNLHKMAYFLLFSVFLISCSTTNQAVDNSEQSDKTIHAVQYEPSKGKINVETAAARSLKYNFETLKEQITPKFLGSNAQYEAFSNLRKMCEGQTLNLNTSLKELDFAILYTATNITENPEKQDNLLTQMTAQNIILASIKAHKAAMYGKKKEFEWNRLIRQYQSQIAALLKKTQNSPTEEEFAYQKELENTIDYLNLYRQNALQNINDFYQLTKIDSPYPELEGKPFYDKGTLSLQSKAGSYKKNAFSDREELKGLPEHSLDTIALNLVSQYPESSSTVNGYYIQDSSYQQTLSSQGDNQANQLLQIALKYKKANSKQKTSLLPKLSEELHKAIYLQLELAHQLAVKTANDYDIQTNNTTQIKQDIQKLEKTGKQNIAKKIEILKAKQSLWENENIADQILAEKAITACSLQFYGGLLKITPEILTKNISDIASYINTGLQKKNQNFTNSAFIKNTQPEEYTLTNKKEAWAHKENWLEELMSEKQNQPPQKIMSKPLTNRGLSTQKSIQLGTYIEKSTAEEEWVNLSKTFSELKKYNPVYEKISIAGISLYRILINSSSEDLTDLCNKIRQQGKECTLRD